jgi:(p)ppGpp synthase/HD superfamily hydrolase
MELTHSEMCGRKETKVEYLRRVMECGSPRAKILKLADRISNLYALGFVHEVKFVRKFLNETRDHILPYAKEVNPDMYLEICDLIVDREQKLESRLRPPDEPNS